MDCQPHAGRFEVSAPQAHTMSHTRLQGDTDASALRTEGASYAAAHLANLRSGTATPLDLATLVQFLNGPMLEGFCAALHQAIRGTAHERAS